MMKTLKKMAVSAVAALAGDPMARRLRHLHRLAQQPRTGVPRHGHREAPRHGGLHPPPEQSAGLIFAAPTMLMEVGQLRHSTARLSHT